MYQTILPTVIADAQTSLTATRPWQRHPAFRLWYPGPDEPLAGRNGAVDGRHTSADLQRRRDSVSYASYFCRANDGVAGGLACLLTHGGSGWPSLCSATSSALDHRVRGHDGERVPIGRRLRTEM